MSHLIIFHLFAKGNIMTKTSINFFIPEKLQADKENLISAKTLISALGCSYTELESWIRLGFIQKVNMEKDKDKWLFEESLVLTSDDSLSEWRLSNLQNGIIANRKKNRDMKIIREYEAKEKKGLSYFGELSFYLDDLRFRVHVFFFLKSKRVEWRKKKIAEESIDLIQSYYNSLVSKMNSSLLEVFKTILKTKSKERLPRMSLDHFKDDFMTILNECVEEANLKYTQDITDFETIEHTGIDNYINLFPLARSMKRHFIFHAGPTNSGKTYHAMKSLVNADNGVYLAPLRLMAMEGYEKIKIGNKPAILKTGEEYIHDDGAKHIASTIEMMDISTSIDIAIIDEIQMIFDEDRGWAWTQAIIGCPAKTIIMTGSPEARDEIERLLKLTGDTFEWKEFTRLNNLETSKKMITFNDIESGDAIIAFSRKRVLEIHNLLTRQGIPTACIYGMLSPEIRRQESKRFASGDAKVIVATDAIGMGLNLPIRRVLFSAVKKFDGKEVRNLNSYELRQISGRAGRYGHGSEGGIAGMFLDTTDKYPIHKADYSLIKAAVSGFSFYEIRAIDKFLVMPTHDLVQYVSIKYGTNLLNTLMVCSRLLSFSQDNFTCELTDNHKDMADIIDIAGKDMDVSLRYQYMGCPLNIGSPFLIIHFESWVKNHSHDMVNSLDKLEYCKKNMEFAELMVSLMSIYIWLSLRWPEIYPDYDIAVAIRNQYNIDVEDYIVNHNRNYMVKRK